MSWTVINHEAFDAAFDAEPHAVRIELRDERPGTGVIRLTGMGELEQITLDPATFRLLS